jgi:hypothetical protein
MVRLLNQMLEHKNLTQYQNHHRIRMAKAEKLTHGGLMEGYLLFNQAVTMKIYRFHSR